MNNFSLFPQTRYQGSKLKLLPWLERHFNNVNFNSVLDAFSGTSSVSYLLKSMNKQVYSNDILKFNSIISQAFIENNHHTVSKNDISFILDNKKGFSDFVISENFQDIYFTEEENLWLDMTIQNILKIENKFKVSLCLWAVFQSCITKRPYGLFHRKNLNIRTKEVKRTFGNQKTWNTPFEIHFLKFIEQANKAVFKSEHECFSMNENVFNITKNNFDLVYLDPPYIPQKGSLTLYSEFYHFLEGICFYFEWKDKINHKKMHKPLVLEKNPLEIKKENSDLLYSLFEKFEKSQILLSYRSDGIPSIEDIIFNLKKTHKDIKVDHLNHSYALSKNKISEVLIYGNVYS